MWINVLYGSGRKLKVGPVYDDKDLTKLPQISEKSLLGIFKSEKSGDCLGDCISNLRGNLVFFEHISKLLISSLTQEKGNCCLSFFHPQTTVDPQKRPHFQTLALKVLLPTTSKPVKWEEEE